MLNEIIDAYLNSQPEKQSFWFNEKWYSRNFLKTLADKCTDTLKNSGFSKGQRLVSLMPNSPMTLALMLSTWRLGGIFCPLNEKSGEISLLKTLDLLKPFAVVVSPDVKSDLTYALKNNDWPCIISPLESNFEFSSKGKIFEPDTENYAVIFSTSGTTGDPKAVPLTHENLLDNCKACQEHIEVLSPEDIFLNVLPNFHAFGFTICSLLPFVIGASQALVANFMPPSKTLSAIENSGANILLLVPTMLGFAASLLERANKKIDGIKLLIAGGDKYNPKMDERITKVFGVPVLEGYGITECSPVLAVNKNAKVRKLGTVGQALPRFELLLKNEAGEILENAQEGVLWVKGPSVASGYYHAPEISRERFIDGWFYTGDYVQIDDEGYIKILDRVTDIIIVGGFNVYPQEVEAVLANYPGVNTAVVVGMPNSISGEVPKAYILRESSKPEINENDLIKFCKERLSHYKVPRAVEFVDSLPISSTGKILRRVLRQKEREKN